MNPYALAGGWLITCAVLIYLPSILDRALRNRAKRLARQNRLGQSRETLAPLVPLPRRVDWQHARVPVSDHEPFERIRENHDFALWEREMRP